MEKIAIISDIHGNLEALKVVLKDIEEKGIKRVFCLGDIVGKGAHPRECLDIVLEKCEVIVQGNLEDFAISSLTDDSKRQCFLKNQLGDCIDKIKSLPFCHELYISGSFIRMFHAGPTSVSDRLNNLDNHKVKIKMFAPSNMTISGKTADIVIFGDLHVQFMEKFYNKTLINCGSVGCATDIIRDDSLDSDCMETTQAFYLIVEGQMDSKEYDSNLDFNFVRVPYDIEKELSAREETIEKDAYVAELREGKYRDIDLLRAKYDI